MRVCGDGRGLVRDSELCPCPLCIIVSNSVLDLNCNCSLSMFGCVLLCLYTVSYTHLDVYKRQVLY